MTDCRFRTFDQGSAAKLPPMAGKRLVQSSASGRHIGFAVSSCG
jgi:hypothetical protein